MRTGRATPSASRLSQPDRDVRPFQSVLLDLGARLGLPGMVDDDGAAEISRLCRLHRQPRAHAGHRPARRLARREWRRDRQGRAEPESARALHRQWRLLAPRARAREQRYYKMANRSYLDFARPDGLPADAPNRSIFQLYSEPLQRFRLAARGHGSVLPPEQRSRAHRDLFRSAAVLVRAVRGGGGRPAGISACTRITQRPMHMYHSWGSQNAWLRQITSQNRLFVHRETAAALGLADDDWVWIESHHGTGQGTDPARRRASTRSTVWTWNAIGKRRGAWMLEGRCAGSQYAASCSTTPSANLPAAGRAAATAIRIPIRSPARRPGSICGCASRKCAAGEAGATGAAIAALPTAAGIRAVARHRSASARNFRRAREGTTE